MLLSRDIKDFLECRSMTLRKYLGAMRPCASPRDRITRFSDIPNSIPSTPTTKTMHQNCNTWRHHSFKTNDVCCDLSLRCVLLLLLLPSMALSRSIKMRTSQELRMPEKDEKSDVIRERMRSLVFASRYKMKTDHWWRRFCRVRLRQNESRCGSSS